MFKKLVKFANMSHYRARVFFIVRACVQCAHIFSVLTRTPLVHRLATGFKPTTFGLRANTTASRISDSEYNYYVSNKTFEAH